MKININITTYIFLLISFVSGYFEYMFLFLLVIFIHEFGHVLFGICLGFKNPIINIYPFGGLSTFDDSLNISVKKELFVLLGGIIFQILFFLITYKLYSLNCVTFHVYNIIKRINIVLISFNFMPIIPLDGGKLLNLVLDMFFSYKVSNIITCIISIVFIIIFLIEKVSIFRVLLSIYLIKCVIIQIKNINLKYYLFLYDRYKNNYTFNKIKQIDNINKFKRDYYHIINGVLESIYLHYLFDIK